ncbi:MAG: ChaN family lipoprotein [Alphaproteobacteria bacterium]
MRFGPMLLLALAGVGLSGCAERAASGGLPAAPGPPWLSAHYRDHPLVGRLWDVNGGVFTSPEFMIAELAGAPFILLGERHGNPDHHRMQAWMTRALIAGGRRPALAFEMLDSGQDARLAQFLAGQPRTAGGLGPAVGWDRSGWPAWTLYQPIAQAALDAGLPVRSANLPRRQVRRIARNGIGALDPSLVAALGLESGMPPNMVAHMRAEILATHCGRIPEAMAGSLAMAQIVRDAHMARAMIAAAERPDVADGTVLIAGAGHARADRAVPWHLRRAAPGRSVASVGLIEVSEGADDPAAYAERFDSGALPFDFVWFTPRADITDPCEKFAEQLRRSKPE